MDSLHYLRQFRGHLITATSKKDSTQTPDGTAGISGIFSLFRSVAARPTKHRIARFKLPSVKLIVQLSSTSKRSYDGHAWVAPHVYHSKSNYIVILCNNIVVLLMHRPGQYSIQRCTLLVPNSPLFLAFLRLIPVPSAFLAFSPHPPYHHRVYIHN
jgi:hypothetical protein